MFYVRGSCVTPRIKVHASNAIAAYERELNEKEFYVAIIRLELTSVWRKGKNLKVESKKTLKVNVNGAFNLPGSYIDKRLTNYFLLFYVRGSCVTPRIEAHDSNAIASYERELKEKELYVAIIRLELTSVGEYIGKKS
ncbi:hypothetical protein RHGRI_021477 [Rhododendron griersonianum]|uniref:Uncharacterized protein n=1 Tax=Rhododendron griersonianum TaxID=479676 RepID=A0AAV6JPY6_9ERIC|nr:hypothetical protein RHGRI_021477 [Rhododendron griersonianum]